MSVKYSIGLDIGTNSVGWSVVRDDLKLVRKNMKVLGNTDTKRIKKNLWGVRLFDSGDTAEGRRIKRTTRRRYRRRRNRMMYLREVFSPEINKIDPNFFFRLDESFLVEADSKFERHPVFGKIEDEVAYHNDYSTIYHLRKDLADEDKKFDLRLVYLALAHIIKYRGHFLVEGAIDIKNVSIVDTLKKFFESYNENFDEDTVSFSEEDLLDIEKSFKEKVSRTRKFEAAKKILGINNQAHLSQFLRLIVGNTGNFKNMFGLEADSKLQISNSNYEVDLDELINNIGEQYLDVFLQAKNVFDSIELSDILKNTGELTNAPLSNGMIASYRDHEEDLKKIKEYFRKHLDQTAYNEMFKDASKNGYAGYIENATKTTQEEFYKYIKKIIKGLPEAEYFEEKMDNEELLTKQRSFVNGSIPNQVHLEELKAILENQSKYYEFLEENTEKIKQILTFRIPYYVGPLDKADKQSDFSWLERLSDNPVRPWNFDEIVDKDASAVKFIEKLTNNCTYFPEEKVLPKRSLLYQKYTIFNELTKVSYTDERGIRHFFSSKQKENIFNELFKVKSGVTVDNLVEFLRNEYHIEVNEVRGIEKRFNSNYSTYIDLNKIGGMDQFLDNLEYDELLEDIIKILTVFEDREMIRRQLNKYSELLTDKQIRELSRKKYAGWGRLSEKLLNGIRDRQSTKSIMEFLISDDGNNRNLMQLMNDDALSFKKQISDAQNIEEIDTFDEIVSELPGSPAIKKGILQSLKIVDEIVDIMGYKPENIVVEMAREHQNTSRSKPRLKAIENMLKELGSDLLKREPVSNEELQKEKVYLYYLQEGKDMYTNEPLEIQQLSKYDVDHIIPRSIIVDNSFDNKVLVSSKMNRGKLDEVPSEEIVQKNKWFWERLNKVGLVSDRKLMNLTKIERGGITESDRERFLNRQLVETRQITKHVANILDTHFNYEKDESGKIVRDVKVVTLKSSLTSQFRRTFDIYKVREINDYHHAHDAYLNAVIANKLLKKYPQLAHKFVYGEFMHQGNRKLSATEKKNQLSNIIKFFSEDKPVVDKSTGEIVWDKAKDIKIVKQVLSSKQMNIVKKVEKQKGSFGKETLNPSSNSSKLIPQKKGLDPKKYGGFDSPTISFSVVVKYEKGPSKKETLEILPITNMERYSYDKNPTCFIEKKGYLNAEILFEFPKYTLFETEDGRRRMTSGGQELQKGNQLVLPEYLVALLYHAKKYDEVSYPISYQYVNKNYQYFKELLNIVVDFSEKYLEATKNDERISKAFDAFDNKNLKELSESMINLLRYTRIGAPSDFNFLGIKIPRARYQTKKQVNEIFDSTIIFQSITGLYETRIQIGED